MPYISLKTTAKLSEEKCDAVKSAFGKAVECLPGKSERWLMVSVEDGVRMWFRGDSSSDIAMVEVSVYGNVDPAASDKMTAEITDILSSNLSISPDRIYVKYSGHENWGWNGSNF